jgi:hypothetical protein
MEVESKTSIYSQQEQKEYYLSDTYTMSLLESDNKFYCRIHAQHRPPEFTIEQVHIGSYFRVGEMTEPYRNSFPLWLKTMDTVCFVHSFFVLVLILFIFSHPYQRIYI